MLLRFLSAFTVTWDYGLSFIVSKRTMKPTMIDPQRFIYKYNFLESYYYMFLVVT